MTNKNHSKHQEPSRRPHFTPRQLLTSEQLNQEQAFHIASLQRALHGLAGSGVVYGFTISCEPPGQPDKQAQPKKGSIHISCGLAFDHHGRQLYWPGGWIGIDDLAGDEPTSPCKYTICVHYAEYREVRSDDTRGCDSFESDTDNVLWVDHRVVFTLKKGCDEKESDCKTWDSCPDINDYVCQHLDQEPCHIKPEKLCSTHCEGEYYDPNHGIPLACVSICQLSNDPEQCDPQYGFCDDAPSVCKHRRFVYRNELLYQLIRGDHKNYAHVESLSWQDWILYKKEWGEEWEGGIPWDKFIEKIEEGDCDKGFVITFSKPIQVMTLHPGSIILSAVIQDARTNYWESHRIPLDVISEPEGGDEEEGCTRSVRLKFDKDWCHCEISDQRSTLEYGVIIELTIRGSLVRDKCGCMLDARPLGYTNSEHQCCQSHPGGDFIALFRVAPK